jgi:glutamate-5-semialdehyde dehydrogenase
MLEQEIIKIAKQARSAYQILANASTNQKNKALTIAAKLISKNSDAILAENIKDLQQAKDKNLSDALIDRLALNEARITAIANSLIEISKLPDPVGKITFDTTRPNGLNIKRITIPLGVIGIIYESRPNVTADAWSLCLKSGNSALLRPGSESFNTSSKIMTILQQALEQADLPKNAISMLPSKDRAGVDIMLGLEDYIDVIIPRGGRKLIEKVSNNSKIPVFKHLDGNCHTYIHAKAELSKAIKVTVNAKMRRPGICGATESLIIDKDIAADFVPKISEELTKLQCEIRGDAESRSLATEIKPAREDDYAAEYLDKIISIKIVTNIDAAIAHINKYSSKHTESIITEDAQAAQQFMQQIDSAIVIHNSSTQFADGGEFGLGAEIGISTGRMHARGPVGLEQLVTYKYLVHGDGQIRP